MPDSLSLPARADAVIIGGGIIGAAAAYWLARAGMDVVLCEKGRIGGEQSGRNWGWVRRMGRDPLELELAARALELWPRLERDFGVNAGFVRCGISYLCATERDMAARLAWFRKHAGEAGGGIRVLGSRETAALFPRAGAKFAGSLFSPGDGRAEPEEATRAFARAAGREGARIVENLAVRDIETAAGCVSGVITERGPIATKRVILAGGVWSRMLCERLGLRLPQLGVINSAQRTAPLPEGPEITASAGEYAFRRDHDGGYVIAHGRYSQTILTGQHIRFLRDFLPALAAGWRDLPPRIASPFQPWAARAKWTPDQTTPFERARVLDPAPSRGILDAAMAAARRDFPVFGKARVISRRAGVIDVLPDAVPVIGGAGPEGLVLATGFSGHGFGLAPAAGELAAHILMGARPRVSPAPFAFSRLNGGH